MTGDTPFLSIVIPAYNEEERLRRHLPDLVRFCEHRGQPFEIIVVDDGSKDDTALVTHAFGKTCPEVKLITYKPNRGKGGAVKAGMLAAQGRYVLFTDADQSTPIQEVDKLLAKLTSDGYDVAIASRRVPGANVVEPQSFFRSLSSRLFAWGVRGLCVRGVSDTQCGFKCLTQAATQKVFTQVTSSTPLFDVEMLAVATREGYRVAEVPVTWVHDPDTRIPYNLRRALGVWRELWRIKRTQHIGRPLQVKA